VSDQHALFANLRAGLDAADEAIERLVSNKGTLRGEPELWDAAVQDARLALEALKQISRAQS
jgi:hypothetical protein